MSPNEKEICDLEKELREVQTRLVQAHQNQEPEEVQDYKFKSVEGEHKLSELFGDHDEMILIHNMGVSCPYCTLWADGFNGLHHQFESRAAFVFTTPDKPETQAAFKEKRGWRFPLYSHDGTSFAKDMKFTGEGDIKFWPGVSFFYKDGGKIYRKTRAGFGPGDLFCSIWHFFDLLPKGVNDWKPQ